MVHFQIPSRSVLILSIHLMETPWSNAKLPQFLADFLDLSPACRALSAGLISLASASTMKGFQGILIAIKAMV